MRTRPTTRSRIGIAVLAALGLAAAPLAATPALADTTGTGVVINEAYLNGGSAGATYLNKFVELYNPTDAPISLSSMSLQYRSATGTANPTGTLALTGTILAKGHYLIGGSSNAANGAALPTPDQTFGASFAAGGGTLFLAKQTTALVSPPTGSIVGNSAVADLLGYGTSNTFETSAAPAASVTTSLARTNGVDRDTNGADFITGAPTPQNAASDAGTPTPTPTGTPTPTAPPTATATPTPTPTGTPIPTGTPTATPTPTPGDTVTIAQIQGTTDTTPLAGQTVTTDGVVTASYPTGGFNGYFIQTPGTGGTRDFGSQKASDAVFVYSPATVAQAAVGAHVKVTGVVSEFSGLTELTVNAGGLTVLAAPGTGTVIAPLPVTNELPTDAALRESLEGMLLKPAGDFTVTDNYDTNFYASVVLAQGTKPLDTPTAVTEPGSAEYTALVAANAARSVTLDDGSSLNFNTAANKSIPLPYLSTTNPVRIGAAATLVKPVVLDYRFGTWNFQPTEQLTAANAATVQTVAFADTRTAAPANVGGDVTLASFNVLNYFTTTGDSITGCTYYTDREGNPNTVNSGCDARGAANADDLARQQAKIVSAINALDADVVSLEEIENSARFGKPRDTALSTLVAALNSAAGAGTWAFVPSPATLPSTEDVIRTAFIYKPAVVETVGGSSILDDPAFANARQPLAQAFTQKGGAEATSFLAIVNHFKSKGSGTGVDADAGDGQGASNASRVNQAKALVAFADSLKASTKIEKVLLDGDFNAYLKEDPIDVLVAAGYVDLGSTTGKSTYAFDGAVGSLDHLFANAAATAAVNAVDIWNINSVESIALEYSRNNYNATDFYQPNAYRSSDHDPILVGLNLAPKADIVDLNLLNINDFHGRIDANTVKFAGTIEQLKAEKGEGNSLLLSDGDNIGASLFASSSQQDKPTIDVLNALGFTASAVGNHEFDQGLGDLSARVADAADWDYLGANIYLKGTATPALQEYKVVTIDGVRVAIIGAVTQETPTLVSPAGVSTLDFGDPVAAVNRVVAQLEASDAADVFVAEYHEGAGAGTPDGATLEQELALSDSAFAKIVTGTSPEVDAIFTGHTHKQYAWDAPIPGVAGKTRPVLQTGSYGENVGQVVLSVDRNADDAVVKYTARNVARTTAADATLVATYPRVATVKTIVDSAIAAAATIGNTPVATITKDITTAYTANGTVRDDRASESTLGNLVADSLVSALAPASLGGAEIGVVNPGGLRADLLYRSSALGEGDGVVTYAEANAVLPFVNNLYTTTLTGAQFRTVLEQQWQTDAAGNVPSRPFLNLGLSKNVSYTYDASRASGDRITSVTVNGAPLDAARAYRIGSFSFLVQGGDNFREFTKGTNTRDSGLIDRDAWIGYLSSKSPVSPAFDRRGVSLTGAPTAAVVAGSTVTLNLKGLDLTSLGSPVNRSVTTTLAGNAAAGTVSAVSGGAAAVTYTIPANASGASTIVITAAESGTTVRVPVTVTPKAVTPPPVDPFTAWVQAVLAALHAAYLALLKALFPWLVG